MSIKQNFPRQDILQSPKNIACFSKNYQNVNSIVKQVQRINLDITNQNQQLKDILCYLNTNKTQNDNKMRKKANHKSSCSNTDLQGSAKTFEINSESIVAANFQADSNQKLNPTRKSRNQRTILKQKPTTPHLRLNQQKQSTEKIKTQQYICNYELLQNHKFKQRKMSKSMKRCQSCSKIYVKQDFCDNKNHQTTQKKKGKNSLNMSTSVLVIDSKMQSVGKQKAKRNRYQNQNRQKISANTHSIILGSPKNMFSGLVVGSSQKSQLKEFLKARNTKKGSLIISQTNKSKANLF